MHLYAVKDSTNGFELGVLRDWDDYNYNIIGVWNEATWSSSSSLSSLGSSSSLTSDSSLGNSSITSSSSVTSSETTASSDSSLGSSSSETTGSSDSSLSSIKNYDYFILQTEAGDRTTYFNALIGGKIGISGSTANDGFYTIVDAIFDGSSTLIRVSEAIPDATGNGQLYYTKVPDTNDYVEIYNYSITNAGAVSVDKMKIISGTFSADSLTLNITTHDVVLCSTSTFSLTGDLTFNDFDAYSAVFSNSTVNIGGDIIGANMGSYLIVGGGSLTVTGDVNISGNASSVVFQSGFSCNNFTISGSTVGNIFAQPTGTIQILGDLTMTCGNGWLMSQGTLSVGGLIDVDIINNNNGFGFAYQATVIADSIETTITDNYGMFATDSNIQVTGALNITSNTYQFLFQSSTPVSAQSLTIDGTSFGGVNDGASSELTITDDIVVDVDIYNGASHVFSDLSATNLTYTALSTQDIFAGWAAVSGDVIINCSVGISGSIVDGGLLTCANLTVNGGPLSTGYTAFTSPSEISITGNAVISLAGDGAWERVVVGCSSFEIGGNLTGQTQSGGGGKNLFDNSSSVVIGGDIAFTNGCDNFADNSTVSARHITLPQLGASNQDGYIIKTYGSVTATGLLSAANWQGAGIIQPSCKINAGRLVINSSGDQQHLITGGDIVGTGLI